MKTPIKLGLLLSAGLLGPMLAATPAVAADGVGDLPNTALDLTLPNLGFIGGELTTGDRDMFKICLAGGGTFSATTVDGADFDTELYLFNSEGRGVYAGRLSGNPAVGTFQSTLPADDPLTPTEPGVYYLAITGFGAYPASESGQRIFEPSAVSAPAEPANDDPIDGWLGDSDDAGQYAIRLTGTAADPSTTCASSASAPVFDENAVSLSGQVGEGFSYLPSVTGTEPVTYNVSANANFPDQLPASLTLNADTGEVSGTPLPGDVGTYKLRIRAHNSEGNDFQRVTITIDKGDITGLNPTISGLAQRGQTLTADPGGPFTPPNPTLTYQWNADGVPIAGETGQTLRLRRAQAGAQITVSVTASAPGYNTVTQTSAPAPYVRERVRYPMVSAPRSVHRGGTVTVLGQGLTPGGTYTVSLGLLGPSTTATADEYGEIHTPLTIPNDARTGRAILTLTGSGPAFTTTTIRIRR